MFFTGDDQVFSSSKCAIEEGKAAYSATVNACSLRSKLYRCKLVGRGPFYSVGGGFASRGQGGELAEGRRMRGRGEGKGRRYGRRGELEQNIKFSRRGKERDEAPGETAEGDG